ncbi:MAG: LapA family protein [Stigonema ocellatum SAG 48.90 = DSM 106950]|nr:LapA family protein [Stigonema ocellatum SAG 48.90 = DSM 106950]
MIGILTLLALLIAIAAVIFAVQNSTPILVHFLAWQAQGSMALVLLLTFTFGVLFGLLVSLPAVIKSMRKVSNLTRKIEEKNYLIENLDHNLMEATNQIKVLQVTQKGSQTEINSPDYPEDMPV